MIPTLLWRCPVCAGYGALRQQRRLLRPDRLECRACGARWRVQRRAGQDFLLHPQNPAAGRRPRPLADWYADLKGGVRLQPISDAAFPAQPGEALYLLSAPATLQAEDGDPLFSPSAGLAAQVDKQRVAARWAGPGRLALSDRRLAWLAAPVISFPIQQVHSLYAIMDYGLSLMVGLRLYCIYLDGESPLPWIHLTDLVAGQAGCRVQVSHY